MVVQCWYAQHHANKGCIVARIRENIPRDSFDSRTADTEKYALVLVSECNNISTVTQQDGGKDAGGRRKRFGDRARESPHRARSISAIATARQRSYPTYATNERQLRKICVGCTVSSGWRQAAQGISHVRQFRPEDHYTVLEITAPNISDRLVKISLHRAVSSRSGYKNTRTVLGENHRHPKHTILRIAHRRQDRREENSKGRLPWCL